MQWSCQGMWWRTSLEGSVTQTGAVSAKALAESVQSLRGWAEETGVRTGQVGCSVGCQLPREDPPIGH